MDDGLVPFEETDGSKKTNGLNPYCSGQWSSTDGKISKFLVIGVLILVVVDNGLVLQSWQHVRYLRASLNLCCSGQWSSTTRSKV